MIFDMENPWQHLWSRKSDAKFSPVTLKASGDRINYEKLERQSCAFATLLKEAGCAKGDRLCFMTRKKETALLIMNGIMRADCMGIPIDPQSTSQKIHSVMVSSDSNWLFTDESASSYPDPLLIDTGEISLGWLGNTEKIPKNISPEFISENIAQYPEDHSLVDSDTSLGKFSFILSDEKGHMEEGYLTVFHLRLFVDQLNNISGKLGSGRTAAFMPESGCRLFRELFGSTKRRGQLYLISNHLLEDTSQFITLLSSKKIGRLFINATDIGKLTRAMKMNGTPQGGVKEIVIWGKQPSQKSLADLKTCFSKSKVINRSDGRHYEFQDGHEEKKSIISRVVFPHKSLDHWEKLFGLPGDFVFSRITHTDYIRDIKTAYLNYWRKVEEKNLLATHRQPVKVNFNSDI